MFLSPLVQAQVALRAQLDAKISRTNEPAAEQAFLVVIPRSGAVPITVYGPSPEAAVNNAFRVAKLDLEYVELRDR